MLGSTDAKFSSTRDGTILEKCTMLILYLRFSYAMNVNLLRTNRIGWVLFTASFSKSEAYISIVCVDLLRNFLSITIFLSFHRFELLAIQTSGTLFVLALSVCTNTCKCFSTHNTALFFFYRKSSFLRETKSFFLSVSVG